MVQKMQLEPLTSSELVAIEARLSQEQLGCEKYMNAAGNVVNQELVQLCGILAARHGTQHELLCRLLKQHEHSPEGIH